MNTFSPEAEADAKVRTNVLSGVTVGWTCPRCKSVQWTAISIRELVEGAVVECENIDECGLYNSYFEIGIEFKEGIYAPRASEPLKAMA